jgi:hypothetical protein
MAYNQYASDLNAIITAQIQSAQTAFDSYIATKTIIQPLLDQQVKLTSDARDNVHRLNELNQLDETYTKTYLDFKENPPSGGIFAKHGLRTTQDWVIALFYLSLVVFSIVILLYAFVKSTQKIFAVATIFTLLAIFTLVVTNFIAYYG